MIYWYVLTVHKREAKAVEMLTANGFETYMPMHTVTVAYHGRKLLKQRPLIPGIIFVRVDEDNDQLAALQALKQTGEGQLLRYSTHPNRDGTHTKLRVRDEEMREFRAVADHTEQNLMYFRPDEVNLQKGERVRIIGGVFDGCTGTLTKVKGARSRRLVVKLESFVAIAAAEIEPDYIQKL